MSFILFTVIEDRSYIDANSKYWTFTLTEWRTIFPRVLTSTKCTSTKSSGWFLELWRKTWENWRTSFLLVFPPLLLAIVARQKSRQLGLTAFSFLVLIAIHSIQDWTATTKHGVTRKKSTKHKKNKAYRKSI